MGLATGIMQPFTIALIPMATAGKVSEPRFAQTKQTVAGRIGDYRALASPFGIEHLQAMCQFAWVKWTIIGSIPH
jgi:hypothetical protein